MYAINESDGRLGGNMPALNTKAVRDLTDAENSRRDRIWELERMRRQPEMNRKKRRWLAKQGKKLAKCMPDASPEQIRAILEHRWSGNLVGSDVIILNGRKVTIAEILRNPDKYEGMTGPDPIEPYYRGGAQTCKVFMNRLNGRPMIYSQAHGGITYRLWHDAQSALAYLGSLDTTKAQAALKPVLHATRPNESAEAEWLLRELAKLLKTTKKALIKDYSSVLNGNIKAVSSFTDDLDQVNQSGASRINDLAHIAAETLRSNEQSIHTDDDQTWRYTGTHYERTSDTYLGQKLREILSKNGWEVEFGLTRATAEARTALKQITYSSTPINALDPKRILNFLNGELHFLSDGSIQFRAHAPSSLLTSVLRFNYDEDAKAPIFRQTLEELFYPLASERLRPRPKLEQRAYDKAYRENAVIMADHVEELLAYFLIPDRWITAWFLWIGGGSNGKTFLTQLLCLLLDDDAIESDRLQAFTKDNFGMERLIGKTIIIDDDLETGTKIPDDFVKKVSETKLLSANRKNKTSFPFKNRCALLLLTNNYPRITDVSDGMTRRIHTLEFPRRFYSSMEIEAMSEGPLKEYAKHDLADRQLINKIEAELPGVVNRLVIAYQRLVKHDGFRLPKDIKKSNKKLLSEANPLPMFVETQCARGPKFRYKTSKFVEDLAHWLDRENNDWMPQNKQVRTMMEQLGYETVLNNGYEHYVGIELGASTPNGKMNTDAENDSDEAEWDDWDSEDDI